jgi:hypothetical protein
MKNVFVYLVISSTLVSCSSLNKTFVYSSLAGAVIGGITGKMLSPDKESNGFNTSLGAAAGAVVGAGVGYWLFKEDPDNRTLKTMLDPVDNQKVKIPFHDIGIPLDEKFYKVTPDTSNIPEHLKNKVKKQIIIEKKLPSRIEQGDGGKSVFYPEQIVIEYDYE